jgi:hypothetical protein
MARLFDHKFAGVRNPMTRFILDGPDVNKWAMSLIDDIFPQGRWVEITLLATSKDAVKLHVDLQMKVNVWEPQLMRHDKWSLECITRIGPWNNWDGIFWYFEGWLTDELVSGIYSPKYREGLLFEQV